MSRENKTGVVNWLTLEKNSKRQKKSSEGYSKKYMVHLDTQTMALLKTDCN